MKKIFLFLILVLLVACAKKVDTGDKVVVTDGDTKIVATAGSDDWCSTGSTWSATGSEGSAKMVVVGIETSGKYKGYCHVTYDMDSADGDANMEFYFDEDNNGYQIMDIDGQHIEMEYTG